MELVKPGDDGWDAARAAWNLAVDQQPAMVARPRDAAEVAEAVGLARDSGLRIAVQAEGHNAGPLSPLGGDTLLLKTLGMTGADVDTDARRARVAAAAKWRDVSALAGQAGQSGLSGSSSEVGVVGYTLGGGLGSLGRKWGLASNSVRAAEVVTADGELVRADRDNEPDLFWALRGGGGSFGVVTALEFELYPVPEIYAGMLAWPWERSTEVLQAWREWLPGLPGEISSSARLLQVPPIPDIPEAMRGRKLVVISAVHLGSEDEGSELLGGLRRLDPEMDTFAVVPAAALGQIAMDPEDPVPSASGHLMLGDLPGQGIDALIDAAGPGSDSPLLSVEVRHLGGAYAQAPADAGALASLAEPFSLFAVGMAATPDTAEGIRRHTGVLADALARWDSGARYTGFTETPTDPAMCFAPDTYDRLQQVKAKYDPDDLFRANHPIPCAGAAV